MESPVLIPGEPGPETGTIEILKTLVITRLAEHEALIQSVHSAALTTIQNSVRCGWALESIRELLIHNRGQWVLWLRANLPVTTQRAAQLCRLARFFRRDAQDASECCELGLGTPLAPTEIAPPLIDQILSHGVSSQNQLLRNLGLRTPQPPRTQPQQQLLAGAGRNGQSSALTLRQSPNGKPPSVGRILKLAGKLQAQLNLVDPVRLSEADRLKLRASLRPLLTYERGL